MKEYPEIIQEVVDKMAFEIHEAGKTGNWDNNKFIDNLNKTTYLSGRYFISKYKQYNGNHDQISIVTPLGDIFEYDVFTFQKWVNGKIIYFTGR